MSCKLMLRVSSEVKTAATIAARASGTGLRRWPMQSIGTPRTADGIAVGNKSVNRNQEAAVFAAFATLAPRAPSAAALTGG
ncbi:hypothetical protein [Glaciimonas sp. PAMC28666]|uniref:hypothetical protein n=1 Tax=Glaciimonas sp. PAMC28666 TaxID=2807626 RepID=UPI001965E80D|nr:hypothetical protein [Glaciimonas sp. PAMC28666]QRX80847.1 hypothetical protein JQN73_11445 [Glaciimonas sp. PAMC28666]